MRKISLLLLTILITTSVFSQSGKFSVNGELEGVKKGDVLLLVELNHNNEVTGIDTIRIEKSNVFSFEKELKYDYEAQLVYFKDGKIQRGKKSDFWEAQYKQIFVTPCNMKLTGSIKDMPLLNISCDIYSQSTYDFITKMDSLDYALKQLFNKGGKNNFYEQDKIQNKKIGEIISFFKAEPNNGYALKEFYHVLDIVTVKVGGKPIIPQYYYSDEDIAKAYESLSFESKNSTYGKLLKALLKTKDKIKVGNKAPDFTFTDINGNRMTPSDFSGKFVVLYFYDSNCAGCKQLLPKVKDLYDKYPSDVLEIIAISGDKDDDKIIKTAKKENTKWRQVRSNLNEENKMLPIVYNVSLLPTYFLISPDGKLQSDDIILKYEKIIDKKLKLKTN